MFGNAWDARWCACFSARIIFRKCSWLLLWFHHKWWNDSLIGGYDRRMKPSFESRRFCSRSAVMIGGPDHRSKPPMRPDWFKYLGLKPVVVIGDHKTADWNYCWSPVLSGSIQWLWSAVGGRWMKPLIDTFQGQTCLFSKPFVALYKYIIMSLSFTQLFKHQEP